MKNVAMLAAALALAASAAVSADLPFAKERIGWNKPQKPFHVIGNIHYVGMAGVSAFLIVTPRGNILTDGGLPESAPFIEKNIQALGVKLSDTKILLNSHAHFDHSGGLAQLKRDTGAKLYASAGDAPILESGHIAFGPAAQIDTIPVHVDHVVKDGETVSLGGVTLTAHVTPGHTPGCTNWLMDMPPPVFAGPRASYDHLPRQRAGARAGEEGRALKVLFFCSITVAGNPLVNNTARPQIADEYRASFAKFKKMDADIFLAPHGDQFSLQAKLAKTKPGAPNPFIDPAEFHQVVAGMEKSFDAELAKQKAAR